MKRFAMVLVLLLAPVCWSRTPPSRVSVSDEWLFSIYGDLNEICRGGSGDRWETNRACETRSKVEKMLRSNGYCLLPMKQGGLSWQPCHR
jgi:hypothetical protein